MLAEEEKRKNVENKNNNDLRIINSFNIINNIFNKISYLSFLIVVKGFSLLYSFK